MDGRLHSQTRGEKRKAEKTKKKRTRQESSGNSKTLAAAGSKRKKSRLRGNGRKGGVGGTGPRLPFGIRRELAGLSGSLSDDGSVSGADSPENRHPGDSVYEYDEPLPQEESTKNRRFDPVESFEFELPEDFQDEEIDEELASLDGDGDDDDEEFASFLEVRNGRGAESDEEEDADDNGDLERHTRMLQEITGLPKNAFERNQKMNIESSEATAEPDDNLGLNEWKGDGTISLQDLLDPLYGKPGYSSLRKKMLHLERKSEPIQAPLPKVIQEKMDRVAAYKLSRDDITKWEPLVKKNREAPTIYFDEDVQVHSPSVGEITSKFKPRTNLEKKISSILHDASVVEAHAKDGAMLLELNKISAESVKERQNRLAEMRSLLFRHEMKAKRIKKIKSKTFHRILKKDRNKSKAIDTETDPEAAKEYAMKQEFRRAEERMTLKHKNNSQWAKRILKRGLKAQDEGTRVAIAEQLHQHALLTRKIGSVKDNSSTDSSSDEEEVTLATESDLAPKLLEKAKDKTESIIKEEDDLPKSGVLSLPFMVRGMEKRKVAAYEEARHALDEYDSFEPKDSLSRVETRSLGVSSGRRVFGEAKTQAEQPGRKVKQDHVSREWDSDGEEGDTEHEDNANSGPQKSRQTPDAVEVDPTLLLEDLGICHDPVFKDLNDLKREPGPRTTFEVSICAPESIKQGKRDKIEDIKNVKLPNIQEGNACHDEGMGQPTVSDYEDEANDENQSVDSLSDYELPSMPELIHRAFAGDDVEAEFEKEKLEALNEENPVPEKPTSLPGWGQWTDIQQKKGLPSWMLEEHESAKKVREAALKLRKDANLKHVILSEKPNKKAEKFYTAALPFPHKHEEAFEQSIRMPLGPDFNTAKSFRELNRPSVVKRSGVPINPIKFKEVNPLDNGSEFKSSNQDVKPSKMKAAKKKSKTKG